MKSLFRNIILLGLPLVVFNTCELETNWDINPSENVMVVDAIITNENKTQEIRIYYSYPNLNDTSTAVSGANVMVTNGINSFAFNESIVEPGLYLSNPFIVATNVNYTLIIERNGKSDSAHANMVPVSKLRDYSFEQKNGLGNLPAITEVFYNWSTISEYCIVYGSCIAAETYYALDIIDIGQEFAPAKQEILFPPGTTITRKKYSLSEEHQEFIRSLLIETEWRGGLFDTEHGNVPTNFTQGTKGWFGVCQVLTDSIVVGQ